MEWVKEKKYGILLALVALVALWPLRVYRDAVGVSWFYAALFVVLGCVIRWLSRADSFVRLLVVAALVLAGARVVLETRSLKETEYQSRIRQLEREIQDLPETSPQRVEKGKELDRYKARMLENPEAARQKADQLARELETLTPGTAAHGEKTRQLDLVREQIPKWYDRFPLNLGLDLRGGTEVRLRIVSHAQERRVQALKEELNNLREVKKLRPEDKEYRDKLGELEDAQSRLSKNISDAVDVIRNRLNSQGLSEIPVAQEGANRIRVQLPGMDSATAQSVIDSIRQTGKLEFRLTIEPRDDRMLFDEVKNLNLPPDTRNICLNHSRALQEEEIGLDGRCKLHGTKLYDWLEEPAERDVRGEVKRPARLHLLLQEPNPLTGENLAYARPGASQTNPGYFNVEFEFKGLDAKRFGRLTAEYCRKGETPGRLLAVILDGKLRSAPEIQSPIPDGRGVITGNFTFAEARRLAVVLNEGSLPVDIDIESENTIGPTLGEDSIRSGMQAIVAGLVLVLVFMVGYYLVAGVITDVGLFINMLFILAILIGARAALTLPGIAGLILTVGMAVDANVLIFERIREELRKGLNLARAVENGYDRAFVTIMDSNITTLITAFILIGFGTDQVKGFGTMLTIGILTSMFVSL
ncbi:MAG: protein translocase subunit SecD, partial [Planctomycetota bacterium]